MDNFNSNKWFREQYIRRINEEEVGNKPFSVYFSEVDPKFIYEIFDYIKANGLPETASKFYWDLDKHFK